MLVIVSVEIGVRELDGAIFLGHALAREGFDVAVVYDRAAIKLCHKLTEIGIKYVLIDKSASISCLPKRIIPCKKGGGLAYMYFKRALLI